MPGKKPDFTLNNEAAPAPDFKTAYGGLKLPEGLQESARTLKRTDDGIEILNCKGNAAGLLIPDDFAPDDMDYLAETLFNFEGHIHLYIGDMLAKQERMAYGSTEAIAEKYHRETKTVQKWKSVCSAVTIILRRMILEHYPDNKPLTMKHYEIVMAMSETDQEKWLMSAAEHEWSTSQLSAAIAAPQFPTETGADYEPPATDAPALSDEIEDEAIEILPDVTVKEIKKTSRQFIQCVAENRLTDMPRMDFFLFVQYVNHQWDEYKKLAK